MDDVINMEPYPRGNEHRLLLATRSAVSDHLRMLGIMADNPIPFYSQTKLASWSVSQDLWGIRSTRRA